MVSHPSHHPGTGTVPSVSVQSHIISSPRRADLSGLPPRPITSAVLGTAGLGRSHPGKWLHFSSLCRRTLVVSPTAVGCSSTAALPHLWVLPRPVYQYLSLHSAPYVLQCGLFWSYWPAVAILLPGEMVYGARHAGLRQQEGFKIQERHDMIIGGFRPYEMVDIRPHMSEHKEIAKRSRLA
jgi:hypothetical protein